MRRDHSSDFDKGNERAAAVILDHPGLHPVGLVEWARRWQAGHPAREPRRWQQQAVVASVGIVVQHGEQMALDYGSKGMNEAA